MIDGSEQTGRNLGMKEQAISAVMRPLLFLLLSGLLLPGVTARAVSGVAPDFSLQSRDGDVLSLAEFRGQVVMINFWATWCGPCREEMPHLEALHQRYSALGFALLGVNVEENSDDAVAWLEDTPVSFSILFDPENRVSELYDVVAMPSTVLVDRQGTVRFLHHGYETGYESEYQTQIRALIRE
jgi:peroxiredoxin